MKRRRKLPKTSLAIILGGLALFLGGTFLLPYALQTVYTRAATGLGITTSPAPQEILSTASHKKTPEPVKGIYMSECAVGTPSFRKSFMTLLDETELNTVVIDIKDYTGTISFPIDNPLFSDAALTKCGARDMEAFIQELHDKDIYVVGRITVFQDPHYAKLHPDQAVQSKSNPGTPWHDRKGLNFIDVSSKPFWDYIVELSKISYAIGFDELNYDYIRYPSDGDMQDAVYQNQNKPEAVETFWQYLSQKVKPTGVLISADLFGLTVVEEDDLGIGQVLERALPHFDYIMPMVYPSHYAKGFNGIKDPNTDPYTIVHYSLQHAVARTLAAVSGVETLNSEPVMKNEIIPGAAGSATTTRSVPSGNYTKEVYPASKIRPWLQSFDYPVTYTSAMVQAQIQATEDAGLTSWIFWDPENKYRALAGALAE